MDLAAIIISILALLVSCASLIWKMSEHFSTHKIQMVPVDTNIPQFGGVPASASEKIGKKIMSEYRDFESGITDSERLEIQTRANIKKQQLMKSKIKV